MSRNIVLARSMATTPAGNQANQLNQPNQPTQQTAQQDNYAAQIVKLIPADIVGVYLGIQNLLPADLGAKPKFVAQSIVFLIILAISPVYLQKVAGIIDVRQRMISILSFVIWGISLGGPFAYVLDQLKCPIPAVTIGSVLVMLYTLIVPLLYKPAKTLPANPA